MDKVDFPETKSHPLNTDAEEGTAEALHPYVDNGGGIQSPERNFDPQIAKAFLDLVEQDVISSS